MDKILVTKSGDILSNALVYKLLSKNNIVYAPEAAKSEQFSNMCGLLKNDNYNTIDLKSDLLNYPTVDQIFFLDCLYKNDYFENEYLFSVNLIKKTDKILNFTRQSGAKILMVFPFRDIQDEKSEKYFNLLKVILDMINSYSIENKINTQIVSISEVYGEYSTILSNDLISKTIFKAINNEEIITYNKGLYLTYAKDMADILYKIINTITEDYPIDISAQNIYLDYDIAKLICAILKSKSKIKVKNEIPQLPDFTPDLGYLKTNNLTPKTSIKEGVNNAIHFIKSAYFR